MEFLTEAAGKNLHLEHLEDEILNFGIAGGRSSINFLQSLRDMFSSNNKKGLNVTVKWDGAPAIFAGPHPETSKFFVAKKSLFNKTPKFYHTDAEINADLSGELASKFKTDLKNKKLQIVGAKGIVGGACAVIAAQEGAKVGMIIHREGAVDPKNKRVNHQIMILC